MGALTWLSKKQPVVALSTAEAEYIAVSVATQEAVWLRSLLNRERRALEKWSFLKITKE